MAQLDRLLRIEGALGAFRALDGLLLPHGGEGTSASSGVGPPIPDELVVGDVIARVAAQHAVLAKRRRQVVLVAQVAPMSPELALAIEDEEVELGKDVAVRHLDLLVGFEGGP